MFKPMPRTPGEFWDKYESNRKNEHFGKYSWTLKTYLYLMENGIMCNLIQTLPKKGIVVAHRDFLADLTENESQKILLVCIKADRDLLDLADIHIVQNRSDPACSRKDLKNKTFFIHYWPQEKLIPREKNRREQFCNLAYFGRKWNLDPFLQQPLWGNLLKNRGMSWHIKPPERWNDYSQIDAVVAIRKFNSMDTYNDKPASKLINSWKAGVPVLLGCESAYLAERKSELDYIEIRTVEHLFHALHVLQKNTSLYFQMVENGKMRAEDFTVDKIVKEWEFFLKNVAIPQYYLKRYN
jgi:hypothetical protein